MTDHGNLCGASTTGFLWGPGGFTLGPCILRARHDGPVHQDANDAQWTFPAPATRAPQATADASSPGREGEVGGERHEGSTDRSALRNRIIKAFRDTYKPEHHSQLCQIWTGRNWVPPSNLCSCWIQSRAEQAADILLPEIKPDLDERDRLRAHILDIDAHATPYDDLPEDPGYVGTYLLTSGALHRALGSLGHSAAKCPAAIKAGRLQDQLEKAEATLARVRELATAYDVKGIQDGNDGLTLAMRHLAKELGQPASEDQ